MVQQFLDYKARSNWILKERELFINKIKMLEITLAQKTPVFEAEHAIIEETPLRLYDCLVPAIRENRRFHIRKDELFSVADLKSIQKVKMLEWNLQKKELPKALEEN